MTDIENHYRRVDQKNLDPLNLPPFNLKSNTATVNNHDLNDYSQILSKLGYLVRFDIHSKTTNAWYVAKKE